MVKKNSPLVDDTGAHESKGPDGKRGCERATRQMLAKTKSGSARITPEFMKDRQDQNVQHGENGERA